MPTSNAIPPTHSLTQLIVNKIGNVSKSFICLLIWSEQQPTLSMQPRPNLTPTWFKDPKYFLKSRSPASGITLPFLVVNRRSLILHHHLTIMPTQESLNKLSASFIKPHLKLHFRGQFYLNFYRSQSPV